MAKLKLITVDSFSDGTACEEHFVRYVPTAEELALSRLADYKWTSQVAAEDGHKLDF